MTQRFEFEVDTTHAIENWEKEVAENIARAEAEAASPDVNENAEAGVEIAEAQS